MTLESLSHYLQVSIIILTVLVALLGVASYLVNLEISKKKDLEIQNMQDDLKEKVTYEDNSIHKIQASLESIKNPETNKSGFSALEQIFATYDKEKFLNLLIEFLETELVNIPYEELNQYIGDMHQTSVFDMAVKRLSKFFNKTGRNEKLEIFIHNVIDDKYGFTENQTSSILSNFIGIYYAKYYEVKDKEIILKIIKKGHTLYLKNNKFPESVSYTVTFIGQYSNYNYVNSNKSALDFTNDKLFVDELIKIDFPSNYLIYLPKRTGHPFIESKSLLGDLILKQKSKLKFTHNQ